MAPPAFPDYGTALAALEPDVVSINTLPDTHAEYAIKAMEAGSHVFLEKPVADSVANAERVVATARRTGRKARHRLYPCATTPPGSASSSLARELGSPLVFRMNLNQQSSGAEWETHKRLLGSFSPLVDCGVHYVDVMCQITRARPLRVHGMGTRLTEDMQPGMYNYGQLQIFFEDGSVGWYEAGWGPMMSETAFFVKDVIGPKGSVSIVMAETAAGMRSADINAHTKTNQILLHHAALKPDGSPAKADERIDTADEPSHDDLCEREQRFLLRAIAEDLDLGDHMDDAVKSLRIVVAADESVRSGKIVEL